MISFHTQNLLRITVTIFIVALSSCDRDKAVFREIKSSLSSIDFVNEITENDSINQLDNGNVYNGGGAGIGDFNMDGLPDIFFTGNLVSCRLYLNQGGFKFHDVTDLSGVSGEGKWCRGVSVVDINNDGWPDIYISATINSNPEKRKNILYVNRGLSKGGIPEFRDMASEYGLDDNSHTTQAAFFDYDNDGDLDVYLVVNEINDRDSPYVFRPLARDGSGISTGRLYRNDWNSSLRHPFFTDVSIEAGIATEGFGNQATILDINEDGWKDIYISNDYLSNDLLWINNHNGTFSESLSVYFKHTSNSAMGNDAGDINNDGLMDIITLDMNPEDNFRKKMMLLPASYQFFQNSDRYSFNYQYTRNTLQLNQGRRIEENGSPGTPLFSDISYYAGIEATDWSWTPLLTDFDNDGYKDLFIANGFPRDITDRDFAMFRSNAWLTTPKMEILRQVPEVKIHNYLYRNNGDLTFSDMSGKWGLSEPSFSNGAAYADLDLDGDLDLVISNINDKASIYRNMSRENDPGKSHYLSVRLEGDSLNRNGIGAAVEIFYGDGKRQVWENAPYRGYLSTVEMTGHFGLGEITEVDSLIVKWQNGSMEVKHDIIADNTLHLNIKDSDIFSEHHLNDSYLSSELNIFEPEFKPLFTEVTSSLNINYIHPETDHIDFNIQKLLPHKFSEYGPSLATGDINGDGLDDIVSGGSAGNSAQLFTQKKDGTFLQKPLINVADLSAKKWDDTGLLLFDADSDGDLDLYIASGGCENEFNSPFYKDHLYINDGNGNFADKSNALPVNFTSKGCVRESDFDKDGDPDLFVSGRIHPWSYPRAVSSFIFRNDSDKEEVKFTDISGEVAPVLNNIGIVIDALFTDFNNDGWPDLILAGEWMPLRFLVNENGKYKDVTSGTGLSNLSGWWKSLASGDFDNDGDIDYVAGNLGLNSYYRASARHPLSVYAGDFDNNGSYDAFLSLYLVASQQDSSKKEFPAHGRDDLIKQMLPVRARFQNYKSLAAATMDKVLTPDEISNAYKLRATEMRSSYIRNDGNNRFTINPLPVMAQLSVLNGIIADDFDSDGNTDLLINCNDFGTEVLTGRYDALNGLLLKGDGKGGFRPLSVAESGFFIPGNGRALAGFRNPKGIYMIAASQNRGPLKIFELKNQIQNTHAKP